MIAGGRDAPSHASIDVCATEPLRLHSPRGGTWTSGTRVRIHISIASRSRSGHRSSRWSPRALNVLGSASTNARPWASSASRSSPSSRRRNWPSAMRSSAGWRSGRKPHASAAVTRWIVDRCSAIRTTWRVASRSDRTRASKSATRVHIPTYQVCGVWACRPPR